MKDFFRNNGALILVIAVLLAAITAVSSYVLQGVPNPLANVLGVITTPIRNGISSFAGWAEGIYNYSFQYDELQAENARLRKEIAELEARPGRARRTARRTSGCGRCWGCGKSAENLTLSPPPSPPGAVPTGPPPSPSARARSRASRPETAWWTRPGIWWASSRRRAPTGPP